MIPELVAVVESAEQDGKNQAHELWISGRDTKQSKCRVHLRGGVTQVFRHTQHSLATGARGGGGRRCSEPKRVGRAQESRTACFFLT